MLGDNDAIASRKLEYATLSPVLEMFVTDVTGSPAGHQRVTSVSLGHCTGVLIVGAYGTAPTPMRFLGAHDLRVVTPRHESRMSASEIRVSNLESLISM